jgi:O-antigen ligase
MTAAVLDEVAPPRGNERLALVAVAMLWFALVLMPVGRLSELSSAAAIVLLGAALLRRESLVDARVRLALALFAAYWLPGLISAFDAVAPSTTWVSVLEDLRFLPLVLAAVLLLRDRPALHERLLWLSALVIALWTLDALVQSVSGWSLGGRLETDRVSGVFGDDNLKLGPTLAVFSPLALFIAWQRWGRAGFAISWLLCAIVVLLAGARAGWVSYAVVTLAFAWRIAARPRLFLVWSTALLGTIMALAALSYQLSERFALRIDRTLGIGAGSDDVLDFALAWRLPIWTTASDMALAHPINGVGVRGFRHAYAEYAPADDRWIADGDGEGAYHAHQLLLELASETGAIGLTAWVIAAVLLRRAWRRQSPAARRRAFAPAVALSAMLFPLNSHFAFYSSYWGFALWWLIALLLAAFEREPEPAR